MPFGAVHPIIPVARGGEDLEARRQLVCQAARHRIAALQLSEVAPCDLKRGVSVLGRSARHHAHGAANCVLAEQRALRPTQDFNAINVEEI